MNFLEYQEELDIILGDTRAEYQAGGAKLKLAIKYGLKETLNRLSQNALYKEKNHKTLSVTVASGSVDRPADILSVYKIIIQDDEYQDYIDQEVENKILFSSYDAGAAIIKYIPQCNTLSADADIPNLNSFFSDAVIAYAMEKYHLMNEDWDNVGNSVKYAEDKVEDLLNKYY